LNAFLHLVIHSKNAGLFQPKCWVKNVIKNVQLKVKIEVGLKF